MILALLMLIPFLAVVLLCLYGFVKMVESGVMMSAARRKREEERKYYALPKILGGDGN